METITKEDFANMFNQKDGHIYFNKPNPHIFLFKNDTELSNEIIENLKEVRNDKITINLVNIETVNDHVPFVGYVHAPTLLFVPPDDIMKLIQGYVTPKQLDRIIHEVLFDSGITDAEIIE